MKLTNEDKLKIFDSVENNFESVISLLCTPDGIILEASESIRQISSDFEEGKTSFFNLITNESRAALDEVLSSNQTRTLHLISDEDIIETFACCPVNVSGGIYIYCVRTKVHGGKALSTQTKQMNVIFQMLLNRMARNENLFEQLLENCRTVEDFFRILSKSERDLNRLTPRELQILLLLKDYPVRQKLSEHLQLSVNTVDIHLNSISNKLNKHRIEDLIVLSRSLEGLIKESDISVLLENISQSSAIIRTLMIDEKRYNNLSELTARELQIMVMLYQNKSNKQIAEALFLSVNTVKSHISRIFKKKGINSRAEL